MRSEIALWPQPAHSVLLPPRYAASSRPMRFTFFAGPGAGVAGVAMVSFRSCARIASVTVRASSGRPS